jgi:hypothetical protein
MKKHVAIALLMLCSVLAAQTPQRPDSLCMLAITTDPAGADIFVDSMYAGKSPLQALKVQAGSHSVRMFYPSVFSWNATVKEDTVGLADGESVARTFSLGGTLNLQTVPSGGTVIYDGSILGMTPLFISLPRPLTVGLTIQKPGYQTIEVPVNEIRKELLRLQLQPAGPGSGPPPSDLRGPDLVAIDHWPTYASGFVMIASGVTSAYLKDQANREFDKYLATNDPSRLANTHRLDRGAAITLVISQISFAVLSYLLLSN